VAAAPACQTRGRCHRFGVHHLLFRPAASPARDLPLAARSVGHYRVQPGRCERSRQRPFFQFYWGLEGWGHITVSHDGPQLLGPGQVAFYRPGDDHVLDSLDQSWSYRFWTFDGQLADTIVAGFGLDDQGPRDVGPCPEHLFAQLEREVPDPLPGSELAASATAYRLLAQVAASGRGGATTSSEGAVVDTAVATTRQQIERHFSDPELDIHRLADRVELHRSTLTRRFQAATGTSPSAYLQAKRLQHALALLTTTDLPVATVARRSGYSDPDYFARRIRQVTGQTPSDFRS